MVANPLLLDIPEQLTSERLILDTLRAGDGPQINAAVQESLPELQAHLPWAVGGQTVQQSEIFAREMAVLFLRRERFTYKIIRAADTQFLGLVELFNIDWEIPACEFGYWLRTSANGHGYMTEAVNRLTRFAINDLGAERLVIRTTPSNTRSAAIAQRCCFTLESRMRHACRLSNGELGDILVFVKLARDD